MLPSAELKHDDECRKLTAPPGHHSSCLRHIGVQQMNDKGFAGHNGRYRPGRGVRSQRRCCHRRYAGTVNKKRWLWVPRMRPANPS